MLGCNNTPRVNSVGGSIFGIDVPDWLDPTIHDTKVAGLQQATSKRNARRSVGQMDFVEPEEERYLDPVSLNDLKADIATYNAKRASIGGPIIPGVSNTALLVIGLGIATIFVLNRRK